jgi:signal transduction histidine kinase
MSIHDLVAPEYRERARAMVNRRLVGDADATIYALEVLTGDGRRLALEVSTRRLVRDGQAVGVQGAARDVTARLRAERQQRFLVEASRVLASSIDYETTLRTLARLAIPDLADWCAVDLIEPGAEAVRPVARAHVDATLEPALHELYRRYPPTTRGDRPVATALRTGRPVFLPEAEVTRVATSVEPEHAALRTSVGFASLMAVPLLVGGRTLGSMTFVRGPARARYHADDLPIAEELGRRAAVAIDNARSHRDAQEQADVHAALSRALRESADTLRESEERYRRLAARLERLQTITGQLGRSLTPETVLRQVTDSAALLMEAPFAAVFLLDGPDDDFALAAAHGADAWRAAGLRLPRRASLAGRAVDQGRTLIVNDVRTDPGAALPALLTGQAAGAEIAAPIVGADGPFGVVKVFSPVARVFTSEDAGLLDALAAAAAVAITNARLYRDAQESLRARDTFLSIAAHELKTPTTAVLAGAQLLARRSSRGRLVVESLERHAGVIAEAAKRLARLVDDLLDVSRVRTGQLALRLVPIDLAELATDVALRYRDRIDQSHELSVALGPTSCLVRADVDRLEQVVENLIDNAIKYSPGGGPVEVTLDVADGQARLRVQDQGIGLPPGAAERIFQPFERAANAAARQLPGMGLGLHICRNIVELHGGSIWAESAGEDRGTTMTVQLPCAEEERPEGE